MWARLCFCISSCTLVLLLGAAGVSRQRGGALFNGKEALRGRIRGHDETLPPETVRCANCHGATASTRLNRVAAPHLDASWLLDLRPRRGGPPSRYDRAAFCTLLRSGADAGHIVIAREMPTYDVDDEQCASLWTFLVETDKLGTVAAPQRGAAANEK